MTKVALNYSLRDSKQEFMNRWFDHITLCKNWLCLCNVLFSRFPSKTYHKWGTISTTKKPRSIFIIVLDLRKMESERVIDGEANIKEIQNEIQKIIKQAWKSFSNYDLANKAE